VQLVVVGVGPNVALVIHVLEVPLEGGREGGKEGREGGRDEFSGLQ